MQKAPNKFTSQTIKNYYAKTSCNVSNDFELSNVSEEVIKKILRSLDTSKAAGMGQITTKFLRDSAKVLPFHLRNIINLSIKLSIKLPILNEVQGLILKTTVLFLFCR